jgi:AraC-like DNA-binding protein
MQTPGVTLPARYIQYIAEPIRRMGGDVGGWLVESGLSEKQLEDPTLSIAYPSFERLVLGAQERTGEAALGLFVGERLLVNTHGILGYAAMSSGTIRQAIELFARYTRLRFSLITIQHEERAGEARILFSEEHPLGEVRRPVLEAVMLSIKNVMDAISLGACRVRAASFPFEAPGYAAIARDLFGCELRYDQTWAGLTLPLEVLDVPLKMADPEGFREAAQICQRELEKLISNESMAARVRRLLLSKQGAFPTLQVTAHLFHMTPRTLHRRLVDEGTSFRDLLEEVRHTLAVEHMKSGKFSLEEIAYTLGYSDMANFRRAFKRWEAVPPSAFRARGAGRARKTAMPSKRRGKLA